MVRIMTKIEQKLCFNLTKILIKMGDFIFSIREIVLFQKLLG
jgi:hypothetical protein